MGCFFIVGTCRFFGTGILSPVCCFKQRGQLKRPDHADLRYKCRTYARLLQHLKVKFPTSCPIIKIISCWSLFDPPVFPWNLQSLDRNCLGPLRKAYCSSLNLLLRREVWKINSLSVYVIVTLSLVTILHSSLFHFHLELEVW